MRIGLDAIPLTEPKAGIGHYTAELASELARGWPSDEFELIVPDCAEFVLDEAERNLDRAECNLRFVRAPSTGVRLRWWSMGLDLYARERKLALFHGTNYLVPVWDTCPTVVTVHDLSPLLHADTHRAELVRRARVRLPAMTRCATLVITDAESVKREVCEHLGVNAERVVAVPLAPRRSFHPVSASESDEVRRRLGVADDFLLFVGTVEPRKNLATLVRACGELARTTDGVPPQLVIAGGRGWLSDDLAVLVEREGLTRHTLFTGYVSDEDLRALYSACTLAVYPSIYEGFGLPPLEAMSCGAPVVTSRIPVLEETCGKGAARLFDPHDHRDLARVINELLVDPEACAAVARAGVARAAQYTWERTARLTREVYDEAIRCWHAQRDATMLTVANDER